MILCGHCRDAVGAQTMALVLAKVKTRSERLEEIACDVISDWSTWQFFVGYVSGIFDISINEIVTSGPIIL